MRISHLSAVFAMVLFVAYYLPIVIKLKELSLAIVVIGGILLVAIDIWESITDKAYSENSNGN